jgi:hypothetical protein
MNTGFFATNIDRLLWATLGLAAWLAWMPQ